MALLWLTQRPKTVASKILRRYVLQLTKLVKKEDADLWIEPFLNWNETYKEFLNEKSRTFSDRRWYTHKYVRKTRQMIIGTLPDMFHYLDIPNLPKDTNKMDGGIFSDLKEHYRIHRSIPGYKRTQFFYWFLYLKNLKNR